MVKESPATGAMLCTLVCQSVQAYARLNECVLALLILRSGALMRGPRNKG